MPILKESSISVLPHNYWLLFVFMSRLSLLLTLWNLSRLWTLNSRTLNVLVKGRFTLDLFLKIPAIRIRKWLSISSTNRMTSNLVAQATSSILFLSLRSTLTKCIAYIHIMRSTHVFPLSTSLYLFFSLFVPFLSLLLSFSFGHFLFFFYTLALFISFSLAFCLVCFHFFLFSLYFPSSRSPLFQTHKHKT